MLLNSTMIGGWCSKSNILAQLGEFQESLNCNEEAIKMNPQIFEFWYDKGVILYKIGNLYKAKE